ncbi:MAG: MBL fold metallo-hydrolase [Dehalococcoidales bacterium]|nr:MBL fold metallo-hydrolase [Dehalococcoidales bacterium]|tara:strand:+ start:788 stop:1432 length:645 start_codon:yes stop_codon:yes gene_type:complete
MTQLDEITIGLYRINTAMGGGFSFNQFLILDEKNTLVHTGSAPQFSSILEKLSEVINPSDLSYIFVSHFESDECGALGEFLKLNPAITVLASAVTARQLSGFGMPAKVETVKPGESLSLGQRELRFISYPSEMHLWEGVLAYESKDKVLFSSDLFVVRGSEGGPIHKIGAAEALTINPRSIPADEARQKCEDEIKALDISLVAVGHGPVLDLTP